MTREIIVKAATDNFIVYKFVELSNPSQRLTLDFALLFPRWVIYAIFSWRPTVPRIMFTI